MAITRDIPFTQNALEDTIFVTCSALMSTAASTAPKGMLSVVSTADAIVSAGAETTAFGRIIDRLSAPFGSLYQIAAPSAWLHSSRGTTEADAKITIGVKLQHGDSSGGGDMADYSTESQPAIRQYFSTARTTDQLNWDASLSTGEVYAASNPAYYDLRGAKRYLRVGVPVFKNRVTTESSGTEQARVGASIAFMGAVNIPPSDGDLSPYSASTAT